MADPHRRIATAAIFVAALFFGLLDLLLPGSARAGVILSASTGSTFDFVGAQCSQSDPNVTSASVFNCNTAAGSVQEAHAFASPGSLGAEASVIAIPCDSSSDCAANVNAGASLTDPAGLIFQSSTLTGEINTTINVSLNKSVTATVQGFADVQAGASVAGQLAVACIATTPNPSVDECSSSSVTVPLNTATTLTLALSAGAQAQGGFSQLAQMGLADASHTFGFVVGEKVFNLPEGVTANDPDLFIFDNVFLPPSATTVPEPASVLLLLTGLAGLLAFCAASARIQRNDPQNHAPAGWGKVRFPPD